MPDTNDNIIERLDRIANAVETIAAFFEEAIVQTNVVQPVIEKALDTKTTLDTLRSLVQDLASRGKGMAIKDVLGRYGVCKLSELSEDNYSKIHALLKEIE